MSTETNKNTNNTSTSSNEKGVLESIEDQTHVVDTLSKVGETVDKGLHAVALPLEGKDYDEWEEKTYGTTETNETTDKTKETEEKGILGKTKEKVGSLLPNSDTKESTEEPEEPPKSKDLTTQAKELADGAVEGVMKVGDKVDDGLHAVTLPVEGKDYDQWKHAKEERKEEEVKTEDNEKDGDEKDFIDKAKGKIGNLFGGKKEESKQVSQ